jgi:predicted nucleic acid-binding protein
MRLVYLDSCAIIEAIEKPSPEGQALVDLLAEGARDDTPFITSELSLIEVLVGPIKGIADRSPEEEDPICRSHHDWYQENLVQDGLLIQTRPLTRDIFVQAALIRARHHSIKTPDAIHVASAYRLGCTYFVTGDVDLVRRIERDAAWTRATNQFRFVGLAVGPLNELRSELIS